ncbi:MAG: hypothetical protein ACOYVF_08860 [Candidatus Zixiibacteriota bacterium]
MKKTVILIILIAVFRLFSPAAASEIELDSNTAFFEGEVYNYIMPAPQHFVMNTDQARLDGYSFAFIPENEDYNDAEIFIGVNIYRIRGMKFQDALANDTTSIRAHFGSDLEIYPVDSIANATNDWMTSFYLNNKKEFIPNVMLSYYDGDYEIIIFELVIAENVARFTAEEIFVDCIGLFKAMERRELGQR